MSDENQILIPVQNEETKETKDPKDPKDPKYQLVFHPISDKFYVAQEDFSFEKDEYVNASEIYPSVRGLIAPIVKLKVKELRLVHTDQLLVDRLLKMDQNVQFGVKIVQGPVSFTRDKESFTVKVHCRFTSELVPINKPELPPSVEDMD